MLHHGRIQNSGEFPSSSQQGPCLTLYNNKYRRPRPSPRPRIYVHICGIIGGMCNGKCGSSAECTVCACIKQCSAHRGSVWRGISPTLGWYQRNKPYRRSRNRPAGVIVTTHLLTYLQRLLTPHHYPPPTYIHFLKEQEKTHKISIWHTLISTPVQIDKQDSIRKIHHLLVITRARHGASLLKHI